jgi:hypothetical protein
MKNLLIITALLISSTTFAQQGIKTLTSDMSTKVSYTTNYSFEAISDNGKLGFILNPFIDIVNGKPSIDKYTTNYFTMTYKIKDVACAENLRITFKFEDGGLLETRFDSKFECKGEVVYGFTKDQVKTLANNKIVKVQLIDGRSYKYETIYITDNKHSYYFRDLLVVLNN